MNRLIRFLTGTGQRRRLALGTFALLALAGLGVGVAAWVVSPALELRAAETDLREENAPAALARLHRYLARWPDDPRALFLAAQAARRCDACSEAERLLTAFEMKSGPTNASRLEWVLLGAQQGDFAGEEDNLWSAVERNHREGPAILFALAKGYHVSYHRKGAMAALNRLLDRNPSHVLALLLRGTVLDSLRQLDGAEQDFRRAVDLAPESAKAHVALASLLNRRGHIREAICHYEQALACGLETELQRDAQAETLLGLARALTDAAELAEAERRLNELLQTDPDNADGLVERGRLAVRQKRFAEAQSYLGKAVHIAPWHRDGQELYLLVLKELGRSEAAEQCAACLAKLKAEDSLAGRLKLRAFNNPGDVEARWDLWLWSLRNGESSEGLAWLMEILRVAPRHPQAHQALADYFERGGQPRRAAWHRAAAARP
jgi:tetratricopeptide (TPR) repeat protein